MPALSKTTKVVDTPTEATPNGHGPKMPRHEQWVPIEGYPGFEALVWTNAPQRLILDLDSGDVTRYVSAYREILTETRTTEGTKIYDSWFDCDGDPLPQPEDETFFDRVPTELIVCARLAMRDAVTALPNSLARRRARL